MKYLFIFFVLGVCVLFSFAGCNEHPSPQPEPIVAPVETPQILDGPGMMYRDEDCRTEYANVLDFDSYEGNPSFAVAFLGYGDRMEFRDTYVNGIFAQLSEEALAEIEHFDFEGDEWYLVIPRYRESVDITHKESGKTVTVYLGEAFTVRCNLSDLHSNLEIVTVNRNGVCKFSPQMGGDGRLVVTEPVHDITDYTVME